MFFPQLSGVGSAQLEEPEKVAEAVQLFLAGIGHPVRLGRTRSAAPARTARRSLQLPGPHNNLGMHKGHNYSGHCIQDKSFSLERVGIIDFC